MAAPEAAMQSEADELIAFLASPRPEVREMALEYVVGLTGSEAGMVLLRRTDHPLVSTLARLAARDPNPTTVVRALTVLVNMLADPEALESLLDANIWKALLDHLKSADSVVVERAGQVLCNVSGSARGAAALVTAEAVPVLVEALVFATRHAHDPHLWAAHTLLNLSHAAHGRRSLLQPHAGGLLLPLLVPFVHDDDVLRRRAVLGIFKNVAFEAAQAAVCEQLLSDELGLLLQLLLALRGQHALPADEEAVLPGALGTGSAQLRAREEDVECRTAIVHTLLLCASPLHGRHRLRQLGIYPILRDFEPTETDDGVREAVWELVELLMLRQPASSDTPGSADAAAAEAPSQYTTMRALQQQQQADDEAAAAAAVSAQHTDSTTPAAAQPRPFLDDIEEI